jgi:Rieske Fe-S protein
MIRNLATVALAAATIAALPAATFAFPFHNNTPGTSQAKVKMIKVTLKNKTAQPMEILVEDKPVTIAANGEYALSAPEGTHIYDTNKALKVLITRDLDGNSCSFR